MGMISGSQLSTVSGSINLQPRIPSISTKSIMVRVFLTTTTTQFNPYPLPTHPNPKGFLTVHLHPKPKLQQANKHPSPRSVSFISLEQVCSNAESEMPDFDFAGAQLGARAQ
jgi:hypothetical protein